MTFVIHFKSKLNDCIQPSANSIGVTEFDWIRYNNLALQVWKALVDLFIQEATNQRLFAFLMQETKLHAALKDHYTFPGASQEVLVDGYWIDVVHGDLLIEIQTRNFTAIRDKLNVLVERHRVRLVHPIAREKWIVRLPAEGETPISRRKSPRRGRLEHVFYELVRIPELLKHPNFSLDVLITREEEIRRADGKGSWRRNGVSITNRRLLEVLDCHQFASPSDLRALLPPDLETPFTNRQLAEKLSIPRKLASRISYCLRALGILKIAGKQNRSYLYTFSELS